MSGRTIAIIGGGRAGASALQTLRKSGWQEELVLITQEGSLPYERPPLSKDVLLGRTTTADLDILPPGWLEKNGIRFLSGLRAERIAPKERMLTLSDGAKIHYHRLLIATGAVPRILDRRGATLKGVLTLREAADADELRSHLSPEAKIVIIGGGLIGLEVAASAVSRGCHVTVVENCDQVLARVAPAELAKRVFEFHKSKGVDILLGQDVEAIQGETMATAVCLTGGQILPCDAVLIAIGASPASVLAESAGLQVGNGIIVDEFLRSSDEGIYAAGDVARFRNPAGSSIRLENWTNAQKQGAVAALNMLGQTERYQAIPWMWSDQFDKVIQIAGLLREGQTCVKRPLGDVGVAIFMVGVEGELQAAAAFGEVAAVARVIRPSLAVIERGLRLPVEQLADPGIDLKSIVNSWEYGRFNESQITVKQ